MQKTVTTTSYTRSKNESKARKHLKRASNRKMRREWLTEDERNAQFSLRFALASMDEDK